MRKLHLSRRTAISAMCGLALTAAVTVVPSVSHASTTVEATATSPSATTPTAYRQLIGTVTTSTYFEASVPTEGTYALEFVVQEGVAYFGAYINDIDLGHAGGAKGAHQTRPVRLNAGGLLVHIVGPDGSGTADVYIVQVP